MDPTNGAPGATQGAEGRADNDSYESFLDALRQIVGIDHDLEELDRQHGVIDRDRTALASRRVTLVTAINAIYRRAGAPTCSMHVLNRDVVIERQVITTRPSRTPASIHAAARSAGLDGVPRSSIGLDPMLGIPAAITGGTLDGYGYGDLTPHPATIGECGEAQFAASSGEDD